MNSSNESKHLLGFSVPSLLEQTTRMAALLVMIYVPVLLLLLCFGIAGKAAGIPMTDFMREPQMVAHLPFYVGMISTLGCFLWAGAAAICFFGWAVLRQYPDERRFSLLLLCIGILTTHLLLDDMFTFHESLYPYYFGWREETTYAIYALAAIAGVIAFRKTIIKTDYLLLFLALGFLVLKLVVEECDEHPQRIFGQWAPYFNPENIFGPWRIMIEDGLKLFGIVSWLAYCSKVACSQIHAAASPPLGSREADGGDEIDSGLLFPVASRLGIRTLATRLAGSNTLRQNIWRPRETRNRSDHEPAPEPVQQCPMREQHQDAEAETTLRKRARKSRVPARLHRGAP